MNLKIENNQIRIDIQDLFNDLSEEEMEELAEHYMWHSSLYKNIVKNLKENLASKNYNEEYYQLLKSFFTYDENADHWDRENFDSRIIYVMKYNVQSILEENAKLHVENYKLHNAESTLYNWILENFGHDTAYKFHSAFVDGIHTKPYDFELARDMVEKVDYGYMVEQWVYEMLDKFSVVGDDPENV